MKLKKVADKVWVNTGIGNVTSVVDVSHPERHATLINFVSGSQLEVDRPGASVVRDLLDEGPGFGR